MQVIFGVIQELVDDFIAFTGSLGALLLSQQLLIRLPVMCLHRNKSALVSSAKVPIDLSASKSVELVLQSVGDSVLDRSQQASKHAD